MAIKVVVQRGSNIATEIVELHETAYAIQVKDGHLHVISGAAGYDEVVALYAPEQWVAASRV